MSKIQYLDDVKLKNMFPQGTCNNNEVVIIDVRAPTEAMIERIYGGINIPLDELVMRDKNEFADKTIVFHCKGGVRTRNNQPLLEQFASKASYCLSGGIEQWKSCGYKVIR